MIDLSSVKNQKLMDLMKVSLSFNALSPEERERHLDEIRKMDDEQQSKLADFFAEENNKEKQSKLSNREKSTLLDQIYDRALALEKKLKKLMYKSTELNDQSEDDKKMSQLINKLNIS